MIRLRKWLVNGLVVIAATVFALVMAEIAVRVAAPRPTSIAHQDRYGLAMHYPGITRYRPQHGQTVTINSAGMRDREHDLAKADGTFRVLLLGDSFMEAQQVAFEASLPSMLERDLTEQAGRTVEVINAGVSGWGTDDQLRYLTEYGLPYDPDLVLVAMTLHNDVSDNLRQYWHTARDGRLVSQEREPIPWFTYKTLELKAFLAVRFQLVQVFREVRYRNEMVESGEALQSHVRTLFDDPPPEEVAFGWQLTRLLLDRLQSVAHESGAPVVVAMLPIIHQLSPRLFEELIGSEAAGGSELDIDEPQQMMRGIADDLGLPLIDLAPAFREWTAEHDVPLYVLSDGHWNEAGHRLATEVVTEQLLSLGAIRALPSER